MNVLFLSQIVPYPPHGGVLQRGYNIIAELGRRANVHLMAFVHPDVLPTPTAVEDSRRALSAYCSHLEYFPLWPKRSSGHRAAGLTASAFSTLPFSVVAHRSAAFQASVKRAMQATVFDILHVDTIALSQFVDPRSPATTVLTHHNIESILMERRAQVEPHAAARFYLSREARKLANYERALAPTFAMNIVVSSTDETALLQRVPGIRTAVVPNGVNTTYFTPHGTEEALALIYTGGMNMFANRDAVMFFLEQIWPIIRAEVPDVRFFAVGQDPPAELSAIAARDTSVVVTGYVDDIRPYVNQAAVYVVPLRVGGGTRLKVLDAMSSGKALVSTSIGCEGIDVVPGTHLVTADTAEAFAGNTVQLLRDPARRRALGTAARQLVEEKYAWRVVGDQLIAAYRASMASTGGQQ